MEQEKVFYKNKNTQALMTQHDYNFLSDAQKEQMEIYKPDQPDWKEKDAWSKKDCHYKWSKIFAAKRYDRKKVTLDSLEQDELLNDILDIKYPVKLIIELINAYWKFDNNQHPVSSWHDKQDLIEYFLNKNNEQSEKVMEGEDWKEKARTYFENLIGYYDLNYKNTSRKIIKWIEDNKHLIK